MFKTPFLAIAAAALLATVAGCTTPPWEKPQVASPVVSAPALPMNGMLVAPSGMSLYSFDKDTMGSGASTCNGPCAALWPPFAAATAAEPMGNFTIVTREDGSKQWAYKGWPLYTYSKDTRAGDMTGDKFKDVWHVVKR